MTLVTSLSAALFAGGCAAEGDVPSDGSGNRGGSTSSGGSGVGGAGTTTGGAASGGTFSSGGSLPGSGGAGVAGSVSAGGSAGASSGGTPGAGGTTASGTGYTFDTDAQGFVATFSIPDTLSKTLSWTAAEGDPAPGALQLDIAFAALDQKVNAQLNFSTPTDFTGKTITARVKLASGLTTDAANPGGAKLYVKTGDSYVYAANEWTNLEIASIGTWITLTLPVDTPPYVDAAGTHNPAAVREIGIEIATSSTSADYAPALVYIDTITY